MLIIVDYIGFWRLRSCVCGGKIDSVGWTQLGRLRLPVFYVRNSNVFDENHKTDAHNIQFCVYRQPPLTHTRTNEMKCNKTKYDMGIVITRGHICNNLWLLLCSTELVWCDVCVCLHVKKQRARRHSLARSLTLISVGRALPLHQPNLLSQASINN